jgi:hypothetical protein
MEHESQPDRSHQNPAPRPTATSTQCSTGSYRSFHDPKFGCCIPRGVAFYTVAQALSGLGLSVIAISFGDSLAGKPVQLLGVPQREAFVAGWSHIHP